MNRTLALLWLMSVIAIGTSACPEDDKPAADAGTTDGGPSPDTSDAGPSRATRAIQGLEFYAVNGCAACHCNAGEGNCNVQAPNIQGISRESLNANLRYASTAEEFPNLPDPFDPHPYKTPNATDEEIDNLAVFLGTLSGGVPFQTDSLVARGFQHYIEGRCIVCHLTSAQGSNQGGLGVPIAGNDPDNIYTALNEGDDVPCHPLQNRIPTSSTGRALCPGAACCSLTGMFETNETVRKLTDTPAPDQDDERSQLAYFLAFIAPPPIGGMVEPCNNKPGEICTLAGNGIGGFDGDQGPSTDALLYYPQALDIVDWDKDGSPDLAVDDWNNHRIRIIFLDEAFEYGMPPKQGTNRIITIAGDGKVTGTDALNHPADIAFDRDSNLYIAGWHNQNIYRYNNDRRPGEERDQPAGICDLTCGPADDGSPQFVFDRVNFRGTGVALPVGIEILPDGRVLYSENFCGRLRILDIRGEPAPIQPDNCIDPIRLYYESTLTTLAGRARMFGYSGDDGPARDATFNAFPSPNAVNFGISLEKGPNPTRVYVADSLNNIIRYVNLQNNPPTVHHFAGMRPAPGRSNAGFRDGSKEEAMFNFPTTVYVHTDGIVYVADNRNHAIRRITPDGTVTTIVGTGRAGFNGDNRPAAQAQLSSPGFVVVHPDGRLFISDTNNNRIRVVRP